MKNNIVLFSLFSPSRYVWKSIFDELNRDFKIVDIFVAKYDGSNWNEYFYNFYANDSDIPGKIQFLDESKKYIKISNNEIAPAFGLSAEEKLNKLIDKGVEIKKHGTDMLVITLINNGQDISKLKNKLRHKFKENVKYNNSMKNWLILHTFSQGAKSLKALNFIKNNCIIYNVTY